MRALLVAIVLLLVPATVAIALVPTGGVPTIGFDPATGMTTITLDPGSTDPAVVGRWLPPVDAEVAAVNLALLPTGDLLYFSGVEASEHPDDPTALQFIYRAHPLASRSRVATLGGALGEVTLSVTTPSPENGGYLDLFCSGTTIAADGTVVVPGATVYHTLDEAFPDLTLTPLVGWDQTMLFDPFAEEGTDDWSQGPDMSADRWYPSALQTSDGRSLVAAGIDVLFFPNTINTLVETLDVGGTDWEDLEANFRVAPGVETGDLVPGGDPGTGLQIVDRTHQRVPNLPMYPRLFVVPAGPHKGDVLFAAGGDLWGPFGEHPLQAIWGFAQTLDEETATWSLGPPTHFGPRNLGAAVQLMVDWDEPRARYLIFGGTLQQSLAAVPFAEIIDASAQEITVQVTDSMALPRWSINGVLLPDGSVLAVGGATYDNVVFHGSPTQGAMNVERFVPDDTDENGGSWQLLAPMQVVRGYHSTSVLLPDARVLAAGHVPLPAFHDVQRQTINPQVVETRFEVYEPPYLFLDEDTRPEIVTISDNEPGFGDAIHVTVTGLDEGLHSVVLMRPGATTHSYDADQRGITLNAHHVHQPGLPFGQTQLEVHLPGDGAVAPPGYYMLFVNEDVGGEAYPSVAGWVHLG